MSVKKIFNTALVSKFYVTVWVLMGALSTMQNATAQNAADAGFKEKVSESLQKTVKAVQLTPYNGLYEVQTDDGLVYVDKDVRYLFSGSVFDLKAKTNLTAAREEVLSQIRFDDLPLQNAIKTVKGKGTQKIAVFEDPNCGYCKRFRKTLSEIDDLTIYTFQYNILSPTSADISKSVWCSANPSKAWEDWMLKNEMPIPTDKVAQECTPPNEEVLALGKRLAITGTPTTYFSNGKKSAGALAADDFKTLLSANKL